MALHLWRFWLEAQHGVQQRTTRYAQPVRGIFEEGLPLGLGCPWGLCRDSLPENPSILPQCEFTIFHQCQVLLVMSSFMSPADSKAGTNASRVRMFGKNTS